jgi:hypothetical protein
LNRASERQPRRLLQGVFNLEAFMNRFRRRFLFRLIAGGGILWQMQWTGVKTALAMGRYPQGVRKRKGIVRINTLEAQVGDPVQVGDTVRTGSDGMVIFVSEAAVFLLREDTRFVLTRERIDEDTTTDVLQLLEGKMLGVFSRRRGKKLITATAVTGIRGSGVYAETDPELTYLCTCYGEAQISAIADPDNREKVKTRHHEAPRFIDATGRIFAGPVLRHTDAELILLESMVGRKPPFVGHGGPGY